MHYAAAALAFTTTVLYAYRTGQIVPTIRAPEIVARAGIGLILVTVGAGYTDLAINGAPFVWRHWLILAAFTVATCGYVGLLWPRRP